MAGSSVNEIPDRDSEAFLAAWSKRYRRALLSFFHRRMPPGDQQEDLVQEVFLRLARRQNLHEINNVEHYLFQSASSVLTDWRRSTGRRGGGLHESVDDGLEDVGPSPERVLLGRDTLQRLISAVTEMPDRTQTIFVMYHFKEKTHKEIGQELGISVRTIEDHIARANRILRSVVDR